jgi:hypothetical protein
MADLTFKINIETESGKQYSYYNTQLAETTDTNISASVILTSINQCRSQSYSSDDQSGTIYSGGHYFNNAYNVWLEADVVGSNSSGSIQFSHTDTLDSGDRLARYRFYGTKVCNVLGFPAGQWQYPVNFQLDDTGTGTNYFSGDVNASKLSVARDISFSPLSNIASNIRFDIDKSVDKFIQFTSGSAADQENKLLLGYDTDKDKYVLDGVQEVSGSMGFHDVVEFNSDIHVKSTIRPGYVGTSAPLNIVAGGYEDYERGGDVTIASGGGLNAAGGDVNISSGEAFGAAAGDITLSAGDNVGTAASGGSIILTPGNGTPSGDVTIDGDLIVEGTINAASIGTGVDNSVVILDSDGGLKTDEIDSRVWGTTLLNGTNGTNNELAVFTDSNSVEGVSHLTYDNQTLRVGVGDSLPRLFLDSTSDGAAWSAQGAHISLGETAGGNASLSFTYTGDGYGRIGMGDITNGVPAYGEIKFTYNTDLIEIPSAIITAPAQPAFLALNSATDHNIAVSSYVDVDFNEVDFDQGSNFLSDTFTAPVDGIYSLGSTIRLGTPDYTAAFYYLRLTTDQRTFYHIVDNLDWNGTDPAYITLHLNVLAQMDANDSAKVAVYQSGGAAQADIIGHATSTHTIFYGHLVA